MLERLLFGRSSRLDRTHLESRAGPAFSALSTASQV